MRILFADYVSIKPERKNWVVCQECVNGAVPSRGCGGAQVCVGVLVGCGDRTWLVQGEKVFQMGLCPQGASAKRASWSFPCPFETRAIVQIGAPCFSPGPGRLAGWARPGPVPVSCRFSGVHHTVDPATPYPCRRLLCLPRVLHGNRLQFQAVLWFLHHSPLSSSNMSGSQCINCACSVSLTGCHHLLGSHVQDSIDDNTLFYSNTSHCCLY